MIPDILVLWDKYLRPGRLIFRHVRSHVFRQVNQDRPRPPFPGDSEGFPDRVRQDIHILYDAVVLRNRDRDPGDIDLLKGILAQQGNAHIAGDRNQRHGIHVCRGNPGDKVGCTRAGGRKAYAHPSGCPRVSVRRMGSALFMGGQDMADLMLVAVQLIIHIQDRAARITENGIHSLFLQTLDQYLGSVHFHSFSSPGTFSTAPLFPDVTSAA